MKIFIFSTLAVTLFAFPLAAADISGTWTFTGDVVGNPINMKCTFTQEGTKVTGSCANGQGSTPTNGSVAADKVTLQHSVQSFDLTYSGTLDASGTSMKGEIAVMGVSGSFTATKDAGPAAVAAKPGGATDISGTWTITGDVVGNAINMKCTFKQDGAKATGSCAYEGLGVAPTTGSVAGNQVTFQNSVTREQVYDLLYTGTLDAAGTAIKGGIAVEGVTGEFSGTKDK